MSRKTLLWDESSEAWTPISQYKRMRREDGEWVEDNSELYTFHDDEYHPVEDYEQPWCENNLAARSGAGPGTLAGNRGTTPYEVNPGTMVSTSSHQLFTGINPLQLGTGQGYAAWSLHSSDEVYLRLYVRSQAGSSGSYERRFIVLHHNKNISDSVEQEISIIKRVSRSGSPGGSNQLAVSINNEILTDPNGNPMETPAGSLPYNTWARVEIYAHRLLGVKIKIFSDPHSHVPSSSSLFRFSEEAPMAPFRALSVGERSYKSGPNRNSAQIQCIAIGHSGWIGPVGNPGIMLAESNTTTINSNSTTAPLQSSVARAGEYVLISVLYSDIHSNGSVPHITPPAGFTRLGFEYVGRNTIQNHRTVLAVYGRYFSSYNSSSKQFTVGGGRSGHWIIHQRHYTNVHPVHPISVTWNGKSNDYLSPNDYAVRHIRPPSSQGHSRGDVAFYAAVTRANGSSTTSISGWVQNGLANPQMASEGGGAGGWSTNNGRLNAMFLDDQWLYGAESHSISGVTLSEDRHGGREGYGRVVLRQNRELDFTPEPVENYPLPSSIPDTVSGIGDTTPPDPDPPEPDPEFEIITETWNRTWYASYDNFGRRDTTQLYQGYFSSSRGYQHSYVGFDHNDIRHTITGAEVLSIQLWLSNQHFYYSTGGTAVIGTHSYTQIPPSTPQDHRYGRVSEHFSYGQSKWVNLTTSIANDFRDINARGITLGRSRSGNLSQYGYFDASSPTSVRLRITYRKQVS